MEDENRPLLIEPVPTAPPLMPPLYDSVGTRGSYGVVGMLVILTCCVTGVLCLALHNTMQYSEHF